MLELHDEKPSICYSSTLKKRSMFIKVTKAFKESTKKECFLLLA